MNEEPQDHDAEDELVKVRELLDLMGVPAEEADESHRLELLLRSNVWHIGLGEEIDTNQWAFDAYVLAATEPTEEEILEHFDAPIEAYEEDKYVDQFHAVNLGPLLSFRVFDSYAKD